MTREGTCRHPVCNCSVEGGSEFGGSPCEATVLAGSETEEMACGCGHADCYRDEDRV